MKFKLKGYIAFSDNLERAESDIREFITQANKRLLTKGIPKDKLDEAARIVNWRIKDDKLSLTIESGRYVRAHTAILRIHKAVAAITGSKHKIGARKIFVDEYIIEIPLERPLEDELPSLPYVSEVNVTPDSIVIRFKDLDESVLREYEIDRIIRLVQSFALPSLIERATKVAPGTVVSKSKPRVPKFSGDPTQTAFELGWIEEYPGKGQYFYTAPLAKLFRVIEGILIEEVGEKLGFQECLFPKLIPLEIMDKMRYLEGICEGMFYVSSPERDPKLFEELKTKLFITRKIPYDLLRKGLKSPGYALAAAQCEPFYQYLGGKTIRRDKLPIKFMDHSGYTWRYEAGGAKGLERVFELQRIELVWAGTPEMVEEIRDQTLKESERVADDILELEWWSEVGDDPFYLVGRFAEDRDIELPDIPKYEIRATLPYRSTPEKKESMAIASCNVHGQHYVKGFSTKLETKEPIWTGCTGLGTTRWLAGFLAQHGFNPEDWPAEVRKMVEPLPAPPEVSA